MRAGRRAHPVAQQQSFTERFRTQLITGGVILVVVLISVFVLFSANQPAYACTNLLQPLAATAAPSATPVLGQTEDDMGRTHVAVGTSVHYTFCPPASGSHYNSSGQGPIQPKYYGPDDSTIPEGWVHNMEHGALVILYNCNMGGCDTADQTTLQNLVPAFPASPVCKIPAGVISPVITRFDTMSSPFAAMVWDHVLFQQKLDVPEMLAFFNQWGDRSNPENLYCNPNASPSPGASLTSPPTTARPEPTNAVANPAASSTPASSETAVPSAT